MLCEYGCNKEGIFLLKNGKYCCNKNFQSCENIKLKNSNSVKNSFNNGRKSPKEVYKDLPLEKKNNMNWNKGILFYKDEEIFSYNNFGSSMVKKYYIALDDVIYECSCCKIKEWNNKEIILELDHIDGNNTNNNKSNLRLLCPNCHSQTETFRGRGINTGAIKVTDEDLIYALNHNKSIRQALISVKLTPKGGNYNRAKKLLSVIKENLNR